MATLMEQVLGRPLHVALFVQRGIAIEGIRQQIQLNPIEFAGSDEVIERLDEILPKWAKPLYVGDEERRRMADSVMLSIKTDKGRHRNYTIQIENHSKFDLEVRCITLWSDGQKVSKPAFRPDNANWSVPAQRTIPIQFDAGRRGTEIVATCRISRRCGPLDGKETWLYPAVSDRGPGCGSMRNTGRRKRL